MHSITNGENGLNIVWKKNFHQEIRIHIHQVKYILEFIPVGITMLKKTKKCVYKIC